MSITAVNQCLQHGNHWSHAKFRLAIIIANKINDESMTWPIWFADLVDLYETAGGSRSTVYEMLAELEAEGVFTRAKRASRGRQVQSEYAWVWKPDVRSADTNVRTEDTNVRSPDSNVRSAGHVPVVEPEVTRTGTEESVAQSATRESKAEWQVRQASDEVAKMKAEDRWTSSARLVDYFDRSVLAKSGRPVLTGKAALGKNMTSWHNQGIDRRTIAAGIEEFVGDPRNLRLPGSVIDDRTPLWKRFVNWFPPQQERLAYKSGAEKSPTDLLLEQIERTGSAVIGTWKCDTTPDPRREFIQQFTDLASSMGLKSHHEDQKIFDSYISNIDIDRASEAMHDFFERTPLPEQDRRRTVGYTFSTFAWSLIDPAEYQEWLDEVASGSRTA